MRPVCQAQSMIKILNFQIKNVQRKIASRLRVCRRERRQAVNADREIRYGQMDAGDSESDCLKKTAVYHQT